MGRVLLTVLLLATAAGADSPRVEALIQQLKDPSFAVRQRATRALAALGAEAIPALERAARDPHPEIRWRADGLLQRLLPLRGYHRALALADTGETTIALSQLAALRRRLPAGTRPDPAWTMEVLTEVQGLSEPPEATLSAAIACHNLHCLLREAGVASGRWLNRARQAYRRIITGSERDGSTWKRAHRLLAVLENEAGRRRVAATLWAKGVEKSEGLSWHTYDEAAYLAASGDVTGALTKLAIAVKAFPSALREARRSSDFHMLQGLPAFEKVLGRTGK